MNKTRNEKLWAALIGLSVTTTSLAGPTFDPDKSGSRGTPGFAYFAPDEFDFDPGRSTLWTRDPSGNNNPPDPFGSYESSRPDWSRGPHSGEKPSAPADRGKRSLRDFYDRLSGIHLPIDSHNRPFGKHEKYTAFVSAPSIPEPSTVLLSTFGLLLIGALRSRQVIT